MKPTDIEGANVIFGADQKGVIPIRARRQEGPLGPEHVVAFELSEFEAERLKGGARVELTIVGTGWPPVLLEVKGNAEA